jgi:predicted RNase H-like HicB family nuclease
MQIQFTSQVFKERKTYVAHAPELDVSSCGRSKEKAEKNLIEAVRLFLEEAARMGTLEQILEEAGYTRKKHRFEGPKFVAMHSATLSLPLVNAKT